MTVTEKEQQVTTGGLMETKETAPPTPEPKVLHKGFAGEIKTEDEWKRYTESLEQQVVTLQTKTVAPSVEAAPVAAPDETDEIERHWFSDPVKAIQMIEQRTEKKLEQRENQKAARESFWKEFYSENEDLKGLERIVQSVERERFDDLRVKTIPDAKKFIAEQVRGIVSSVKTKYGVTETELTKSDSPTLTSKGTGSVGTGARSAAPLNFVEQMKQFRARGKK